MAARGAQRLAGMLEDPKETDADRLSTLGEALAELAAKMEPKEAAVVAPGAAWPRAGGPEGNRCWPPVYARERAGRAGGQDGADGGGGSRRPPGQGAGGPEGNRCWPPVYARVGAGRAGGQDGAQGGGGCGGPWRAALGRLAGGPEGNRC